MPSRPTFILASASKRRREILRAAGYRFKVLATGAPEKDEGLVFSGIETALFNAMLKAKAGAAAAGGIPVLAADTVVDLGGRLLGKPGDLDEARAMLGLLSGRAHLVTTAAALWVPEEGGAGRFLTATCTTRVEFNRLDGAMIERYIREVNPLDKAGAYGAQESASVKLLRRVDGPLDNVYGLPLASVGPMLAKVGILPSTSRANARR